MPAEQRSAVQLQKGLLEREIVVRGFIREDQIEAMLRGPKRKKKRRSIKQKHRQFQHSIIICPSLLAIVLGICHKSLHPATTRKVQR